MTFRKEGFIPIYHYYEIVVGLIHYLIVHQMWLLPSCYRIGWCIPVARWRRPPNQLWLVHLLQYKFFRENCYKKGELMHECILTHRNSKNKRKLRIRWKRQPKVKHGEKMSSKKWSKNCKQNKSKNNTSLKCQTKTFGQLIPGVDTHWSSRVVWIPNSHNSNPIIHPLSHGGQWEVMEHHN